MEHLKTLVIHPDDRSTDFLSAIYADLPNKTVVTGSSTPSEVRRMIQTHERVMMMGHGTPGGLMAVSQFPADDPTPIYSVVKDRYYEPKPAYIIDSETVAVLREKDNSVFIWCNADQFVNRFQLKGFYTGMFISEYGEASYCGVKTINGEVEFNNSLFARLMSDVAHENPATQYAYIKENFHIPRSKVIEYNWNRMYLNS